jgi:hypothetical protein
MVWDAATNSVVLFGGGEVPSALLNDTWVWHGQTWSKEAPAHQPPPIYHPMLAYDAFRHSVLLAGPTVDYSKPSAGIKLVRFVLWSWDGCDWSELHPTSSPSPRYGSILAFDAAHRELVLAGGQTPMAEVFHETWVWDGHGWSLKDSGSPPLSETAAAVYDPVSGRVVAFAPAASTFAWNGSTWAKVNTAQSPSGYGLHALTPLSESNRIGGLFADAGGATFWEWRGTDWAAVWPTDLASWRTYDPTPTEGFKLRLPPYWYVGPGFFSNENVGAPLELDRAGAWVTASVSTGPSCQPPREVASASTPTTIAGRPAIRYTFPPGGPDGISGFLVQTTGMNGCITLGLSAFAVEARDANAVLFNQMVSGFALR